MNGRPQRIIRGGLSALALRGVNAGQGQLILDGIPLYSSVPGNVVYNQIHPGQACPTNGTDRGAERRGRKATKPDRQEMSHNSGSA